MTAVLETPVTTSPKGKGKAPVLKPVLLSDGRQLIARVERVEQREVAVKGKEAQRNRVFVDLESAASLIELLVKPTERPHIDVKPAVEKLLRSQGYTYRYLGWNPKAGKDTAGFTMDGQTRGRKRVAIFVTFDTAGEPTPAEAEGEESPAEVE